MKIIIDTAFLKKAKVSVNEYLTLLCLNSPENKISYTPSKADYLELSNHGLILLSGSNMSILPKGIEILEGKAELRPYEELVEELRVAYPSGKKDGKWPWRGFSKDIENRLRKLDKNSDLSKYSNEEVIQATKEYVSNFSLKDMDRGMQLLQYFIEKEGSSSLLAWLESEDKPEVKSSIIDVRL